MEETELDWDGPFAEHHWQRVERTFLAPLRDVFGSAEEGPVVTYSDFFTELLTEQARYVLRAPGLSQDERRDVLKRMADPERQEGVTREAQLLYGPVMWARGGRRIFRLSNALVTGLSHTSLTKIPSDLVRLPFPALYVEFPQRPTAVRVSFGGAAYRLDGAYLAHAGNFLTMVLAAAIPQDRQLSFNAAMRLEMTPGSDLRDVLTEALANARTFNDADPDADAAAAFNTGRTRERMEHATLLILNALLYIASPNPDLGKPQLGPATQKLAAHPRKESAWKERMRRLSRKEPIVIDVGRNLAPQPELERGRTDRTLSVRFIVRGHWRSQPFGPGHQERRPQWIQPYWKGPPLAEVVHRDYVLTDKDKDKG